MMSFKGNAPEGSEIVPGTIPYIPKTSDDTPKGSEIIPETIPYIPKTSDNTPKGSEIVPGTIPYIPKTSDNTPKGSEIVPGTIPYIPKTSDSIPESCGLWLQVGFGYPPIPCIPWGASEKALRNKAKGKKCADGFSLGKQRTSISHSGG